MSSAENRIPEEAGNWQDRTIRVRAAVDWITQTRLLQPQVAIILGSGLGELADDVVHATSINYRDIPNFRQTHAHGHAGKLILGYLGGVPVVVMQGRYHRYEGHDAETVTFPVEVMAALGAQTLVVTNAAGGLNPRYRPGDLMIVDQHINWLWNRRTGIFSALVSSPNTGNQTTEHSNQSGTKRAEPLQDPSRVGCLSRLPDVYDHELSERIRELALGQRIGLHRGTYVATLGPTYETRSEYRMFRWMGGDAVGMSTVPEVCAARALGLRVLALSVITNVASTDSAHGTSHEEVVACGKLVGPRLRQLVRELLEQMAGPAD